MHGKGGISAINSDFFSTFVVAGVALVAAYTIA